MKQHLPLLAVIVATAVLTLAAIANPGLFLVAVIVIAALVVFGMVKGWWRRIYVVTILAMFAGASHIVELATIGAVAKVAAVGLLAVVTLAVNSGQDSQYKNRMHKAVMALLWVTVGLAVTSILWSHAPMDTLIQAATLTAFVFILHRTSTVRWQDPKIMAGDIGTAYWASTGILAVGTAMAFAGYPEAISSFSNRHQGVLNNPNLLGMIAAVTLTIGIAWAAHKRNPLVWISLLIPASQVVLSESRTAMVAAAAAIVWAVVRGSAVRVMAAAGALVLVWVVTLAIQIDLFGDSLERFSSTEGGGLLNARTLAWTGSIEFVGQNPLGIGWAATTEALASMNASGVGAGLTSVHNSYLQIVFELGWIGLIPAGALIVLLLLVATRSSAAGMGTGLVATVVAGGLIQLAESSMFGVGQPYPYLFWIAVIVAIVNTEPKPRPERKPRSRYQVRARPGNFPALAE